MERVPEGLDLTTCHPEFLTVPSRIPHDAQGERHIESRTAATKRFYAFYSVYGCECRLHEVLSASPVRYAALQNDLPEREAEYEPLTLNSEGRIESGIF